MCRFRLPLGLAIALLTAQAPRPVEAQQSTKTDQDKPLVAVFTLKGELQESPNEDLSLFGSPGGTNLRDLVSRMKKAGEDPAVKAVVILLEGGTVGPAQREELIQAMAGVRKRGKDVCLHADSLSMGEYMLATGASRISVVPTGDLWITGLHGEAPYIRGLLNKIGVTPDYLTCGAYKSAAELFMREGPSPEAERMQNWILDSMYTSIAGLIARGRGVDPDRVKHWIDNGPYNAEQAKEAGLIDAVEQREDFESFLKKKFGQDIVFEKKYGKKKQAEMDLSSPFAVFKIWGDMLKEAQAKKAGKAAVGVVYVDGPIILGGGSSSPFEGGNMARSTDIRKAIDEAARDDSIKAVVLRIDSPGGSAVASEIILAATRRLKQKKPFLASMGNVAGSGGYYVACAADTVYADETTITASIGVVAGKFVTDPMWKKLGISFKEYNRGANAALLSSARPFNDPERQKMQQWMNSIYDVFKGHVKAIRGAKLKKPLDELAGGRVFTGKQALELGLVDKIGSLEDAIREVAARAKLSDYDVRVVPKPKNFIERLMEELAAEKETTGKHLRALTPGVAQPSLVDLAMPYLQHLDPERVALVRRALGRMQLIQREGAALLMPELLFSN